MEEVTNISYPWMTNLESTLSSPEGTKALESYLARCGCLSLLEFVWACDGMKSLAQENPQKVDQLVSCIYKNYIVSGSLPILSNQVVMSIARQLESHFERPEPSEKGQAGNDESQAETKFQVLDISIFEDAKSEVEIYLRSELFPQFQRAVNLGNVCVAVKPNECSSGAPSSTLPSHPEAFARALCEKLEDLKITRESNN